MRLFTDKRYICEIHRDLYEWINMQPAIVDKEVGIALVDEAFHAGKRMSAWMKKENLSKWKRALIIDYPWGKTWLPLYINSFQQHGYKVALWDGKVDLKPDFVQPDVVLCTWADRTFTGAFPDAKHILMMRRFEFFHSPWRTWDWDKISAVICCNPWIANEVAQDLPAGKVTVIFNPIDTNLWDFKEREPGKRIGMVCRVHPVKNLALAGQIMLSLPTGYELHIAGKEDDGGTMRAYLETVLWGKRVKWHGQVKNEALNAWWNHMNYCLSTSASEGDPMNVLEAMAKGIKPVIHAWPGAKEMYPQDWVFDSAGMAAKMIEDFPYESNRYLDWVTKNRPVSLADRVVKVCIGESV
jgi:glycosyltransferase involved in cell wall biosynthesis